MRRFLFLIAAAALLAAGAAGPGHGQGRQKGPHLGSSVIFVRYETPEVSGQPRAAFIVWGPFTCPPEHPHAGMECANVDWLTKEPSDPENLPPELIDFRFSVPHDPTGQLPRSWHVWGEAPGEE